MNWSIYSWCVAGVGISVLLPILWETVYAYFPKPKVAGPAAIPPVIKAFWKVVLPYVILGLASAVTSFLIVALSGDTLSDYRAALLAGYAWDSTLQKFRR